MDEATIESLGRSIARHLAVERLKLLGPSELADVLGVTRQQVYRLIRTGRLPPGIKVGKSARRWTMAEALAALRRPTRRRRPAAGD